MKTLTAASEPARAWPEEYEYPPDEDEKSEDGLAVSEAEYWERYYNHPDFSYEWNNGYLEEKPVSDIKGSRLYRWFCKILECFFSAHPVGEIINLDIGFRLALPDKTSIRKPDLAVILNTNAVAAAPDDATYPGIYDICVESLSHSKLREILRDTSQKKKEYEGIGVQEYYILDARGKETAFFRLNRARKYVAIKPADGVIQSVLLPEFRFRLSDLYRQPSLEEMAGDEVYKGYVLPFYQEARAQAEREKRNAEKERQRNRILDMELAAERQRAERLAAKLRELGISPEDI